MSNRAEDSKIKAVKQLRRFEYETRKEFYARRICDYQKPELVEVGNNVRIADFCRISSACVIGSDCEIAPGTYIAGGDGKYTFEMGDCSSLAAGVKVWLSSNDYVNELVTHSIPEVKEIQGNVRLGKYTGVGTNSVIMPGNDIPEGVSIGALSFVPSNYKFEPWTVYAGRPIRPIKKRNKENVIKTLRKAGYLKD